MVILSGQANQELVNRLAPKMGAVRGEVDLQKFPNGEKRVRILTPLQRKEVIIVQSLSNPVDEHFVELLLLIDAAERAGAHSTVVVIPWLGYSLQDKTFLEGMPISARVIADSISNQHVQSVVLADLHNPSVAGFFSVPTRVLDTFPLFAKHIQENIDEDFVVVAPDFGGLKRAHSYAEKLNAPLAHIEKTRNLETGEVTIHSITGANIAGKACVVIDDVVNSGSTVVEVAEALQKAGAKSSHFYVTHFLYVPGSMEKLVASPLNSIVITDSISPSGGSPSSPKTTILSLVDLITKELQTT